MAVNGSGTTTPAAGSHDYAAGTVVNIRAIPATGWEFDMWIGDVATVDDVDAASTTITMYADYSITANFSKIQYTLTMEVDGDGSTTPAEGDHTYDPEKVVTITAKPATGWRFDMWIGDVGTVDDVFEASTTITMDDDYSITASFVEL